MTRVIGLGLLTGWGAGAAALPADARAAAGDRRVIALGRPPLDGERFRRATRECLLGVAAVDAMLADAGLSADAIRGPDTALVYATAAGYGASNRAFVGAALGRAGTAGAGAVGAGPVGAGPASPALAAGGPSQKVDGAGGGPFQKVDGAGGGPSQKVDGAGGGLSQKVGGAGGGPAQKVGGAAGGVSQKVGGSAGSGSGLYFPYTAPSAVPAEVAIAYGLRGGYVILVGGPTAGVEALWQAATLLAAGRCERAVVLAVETFAECEDLWARGRWLVRDPLVESATCALLEGVGDVGYASEAVPAPLEMLTRRRAGQTLACEPLIGLALAREAGEVHARVTGHWHGRRMGATLALSTTTGAATHA